MTGFDHKSLHLLLEDELASPVDIALEVDFLGDGTWVEYATYQLLGKGAYTYHEFPDAFSARWV